MAVATDTRAIGEAAAIAIDATVVVVHILVAGPISRGSMDPARSAGRASLSGRTTALGVCLLAPPLGAATGASLYQRASSKQTRRPDRRGASRRNLDKSGGRPRWPM